MDRNLVRQVQDFAKLWGGFRISRVILTANNYAVFEHLRTPKPADEIARLTGVDRRAVEILLDAVTAVGLLKKTGTRYRVTPVAKQFLLKDSPWYQGDMLRHADFLWKNWSGLDEVVRTGLPNRPASSDNEPFIKAMHNNAVLRAEDVVNGIDLRGVKKALDLGGGPGTYSRELARQGVSVTLFDLPETIEIARQIIPESDTPNLHFASGNFLSDDIGSGYDLVFISQIFHSFSADDNLALLKKAYDALNPRGSIAVQEFLLEKSRTSPVSGALFSVNMLVNTASGRSYTSQEMKMWLKQSGFKNIRAKILNETVLVLGKKK
jgi:2-polyprenyl-3-methyl-5-hydroxy-6-metoxy-1,4-benzoquinol methylase